MTAVIMRGACRHCGEASFGWVSAEIYDEQRVTRIAEYHADGCPVLVNGAYIIATMPISRVLLAAELLKPAVLATSPDQH